MYTSRYSEPFANDDSSWSDLVCGPSPRRLDTFILGVLPGEGIGPEIVNASLSVLEAVRQLRGLNFEVSLGGAIGVAAIAEAGKPLTDDVTELCRHVFAAGGAVLAGAGGSRFVYDMRREFDLYCKLNPLVPHPEVSRCAVVKQDVVANVDIMVVRDNSGGVYQGQWSETHSNGAKKATHAFSYTDQQVRRVVRVAAEIARRRQGRLAVIVKNDGVPTISRLWRECTASVADEFGVELETLDIDYSVYRLIQDPSSFDVIVTSNLFGDVIADVGGVLLGSRGLCYGVSYSADGAAVYQTNHGAAHDLAGKDTANPVAQILALSALLRERFNLASEASLIESAISQVWQEGYRTFDVMEAGCELVGTRRITDLIVERIRRLELG